MPRTTFGPSTRSQSSCNSPIGCCFRPGDTRPPGAGTSCAGESGGQRTFSIAIAVAFLGRPRAAPINRHSPDSGQFLGQSHPLDRLGQRQIGLVGKRRSKPAVDGTATLIRAVLPESRHASPLVARASDLPGSSCRRGWCSQPGDQGPTGRLSRYIRSCPARPGWLEAGSYSRCPSASQNSYIPGLAKAASPRK